MLADRDIICISGVAWDSYWISLHQYMSRLARTHRVLFVNRPVALPSAIARGTRKAEDRANARGSVRRVDERLYVADPPAALPLRFERPVTVVNQDARHRRGPNREAGRPMGLALLGHRRSSDWARLQS